jgi:hypothetical protein
MHPIVVSSKLKVRAETLWGEQSIATVNYELGPWLQMTAPPAWRHVKLRDFGGAGPYFKSWILLLGLFPVDRHAFGSLTLGGELRFVETSSSWLNRAWRHERAVKTVAGGCEVVDTVCMLPRLRFIGALLRPLYQHVFRHRHARLKRRHGALGA